ncbi:MAG: lactaldehyde dehydrogenase [Methanobrevibacter sp.]|nr:lactaldehyde dehydrogenase [Methanobrevibacter sp.]
MKMLINGKFEDREEVFDIINPYNNEIVDTVPVGNREDAKLAIVAANKAKKELTTWSSRKVSEGLYSAYEVLKSEQKKIAKLLTAESGKPIKDSLVEMARSVDTLKFAAEESKRIYGETVPLDAGINGKGFFAFTQKIPLGVVGAITPFNYPVNLSLHKLAPAVAAKNAVIMKPPLQAPLAAMKMAEIIASEFPDGVVNTVTGSGREVGDELVVNENINKISFTGGVATGLSITSRAGMKKVTLELGGNDPLVVLEDANIEKAVSAGVLGSYLFSGQVCMAVKRIIVDEKIADEFTDLFVKETEKLKIGDPMNPKTDIGPLIDEDAAKMIEQSVVGACNEGAELLTGGNRDGNFFQPTVLDNISPDMEVVVNETFGPVSPIIKVNGVEEAIAIANNTEFGLQAGVFTESIRNGLKCANEIEAGSVFINKQSTFRTDNMPFGGFKMSGMGKEGVKYAVEDMTKTKLIGLNLR